MIRQLQFLFVNALLLLFSVNTHAYEVSVEFSADAIQVAPGRPPMYSKMFVSKDAVRTEMMQKGKRLIDIAYPKQGKRYLINLDEKTYIEQKGLAVSSSWSNKKAKTPCEGVLGANCKNLGKETLHGIKVNKWQVERELNGKTFRSLHWIDHERRLAIKEMLPDGSVTELIMRGKTDLNGRPVEKWESHFNHPSGERQVSRQWYDPQLKIVIREEMEGGYLRELNNIKIARQDKGLFVIPKDCKKVSEKTNNIKQ